MPPDLLPPPGSVVSHTELRSTAARELASSLGARIIAFATLIELRQDGHLDVVVFDVDVEVPRSPVHDIRECERIAAVFGSDGSAAPVVYALRRDFPLVSHLNLGEQELPRSICLYAARFEEVRRRWTPARFVEEIRRWLALTARDELHQPDQPLEPLFLATIGDVLLPSWARAPDDPAWEAAPPIALAKRSPPNEPYILVSRAAAANQPGFVVSRHTLKPQHHSIVRNTPTTLAALCAIFAEGGTDLITELRQRLREWKLNQSAMLAHQVIVLAFVPRSRDRAGPVERTDVVCAHVLCSGRELGVRLGVWESAEPEAGLLLVHAAPRGLDTLAIGLLNVSFFPTPDDLARLNDQEASDQRILCIGAGALGSQVAMNFARAGFGRWTIVDHDWLRPHNLARHGAGGVAVGFRKAFVVATELDGLSDGGERHHHLSARLADPNVQSALDGHDLVLDLSASASVSRSIARTNTIRRALCAFVTPSGADLIVFAEDRERTIRLDQIEFAYLRAVHRDPELAGHLTSPRHERYAQGCTDVSSRIRQDRMCAHAGIATGAVREFTEGDAARAVVWRLRDDWSVARVDIDLWPPRSMTVGPWRISTDQWVVEQLRSMRRDRLPNETGGVVVGAFDFEHRVIHIADVLPAPRDSVETPTGFVRGHRGLQAQVATIASATRGELEYLGEWHSHPAGASTRPSRDDAVLLGWVSQHLARNGTPAVMLIVGDHEIRVLIGQLKDGKPQVVHAHMGVMRDAPS